MPVNGLLKGIKNARYKAPLKSSGGAPASPGLPPGEFSRGGCRPPGPPGLGDCRPPSTPQDITQETYFLVGAARLETDFLVGTARGGPSGTRLLYIKLWS